ncbi:MAG: potassium transporter Kup [Acidobacteriota bacterium]
MANADPRKTAPQVDSNVRHLALGALGVVYGDIGTSPLYAFRECFASTDRIMPRADNILGVLSLILWSLIAVVSIKYLIFVLKADNEGEGGILALMALVTSGGKVKFLRPVLLAVGVFGAALLYGDGMITPAISVLSAVEGLQVATHAFEPYVVPIAIGILIALFLIQKRGTGAVGAIFGPVTLLWFICLGLLGLHWIVRNPGVLAAANPWHAVAFFERNRIAGFSALGGVFLVVTGAETLYADMGHFGKRPIRLAWFAVALPGLLLNYFGQGALLLRHPEAVENPFFMLAPTSLLYPLVIFATLATVIASQAVISGAFSLSRQALRLGYLPRISIKHTSSHQVGQVYIPIVNWLLLLCAVGLVLGFGSSSNLAGAYGIAITTTMVITTLLAIVCARTRWGWNWLLVLLAGAALLFIDLAFFGANTLKIVDGGWVPLLVAALVFIVMRTWKLGRTILGRRLRRDRLSTEQFLGQIKQSKPVTVQGTAVFLDSNETSVPATLVHNVKYNKVLHKRVIILTILTEQVPRVSGSKRLQVETIRPGMFRVTARYGFMQAPNVPALLKQLDAEGIAYDPDHTVYFLGQETLVYGGRHRMANWRKRLFAFMSRNAQRATSHFGIPANRVIEVGVQVQL